MTVNAARQAVQGKSAFRLGIRLQPDMRPPGVRFGDHFGFHPEHVAQQRFRQHLNNIVEQDHRIIKKRIRPMLGFKSFVSASATLEGSKVANMIRKGQMTPGLGPFAKFAALAAKQKKINGFCRSTQKFATVRFGAWLHALVRSGGLRLAAPTRFHATSVGTNLKDRMLAALRKVDPTVRDVQV